MPKKTLLSGLLISNFFLFVFTYHAFPLVPLFQIRLLTEKEYLKKWVNGYPALFYEYLFVGDENTLQDIAISAWGVEMTVGFTPFCLRLTTEHSKLTLLTNLCSNCANEYAYPATSTSTLVLDKFVGCHTTTTDSVKKCYYTDLQSNLTFLIGEEVIMSSKGTTSSYQKIMIELSNYSTVAQPFPNHSGGYFGVSSPIFDDNYNFNLMGQMKINGEIQAALLNICAKKSRNGYLSIGVYHDDANKPKYVSKIKNNLPTIDLLSIEGNGKALKGLNIEVVIVTTSSYLEVDSENYKKIVTFFNNANEESTIKLTFKEGFSLSTSLYQWADTEIVLTGDGNEENEKFTVTYPNSKQIIIKESKRSYNVIGINLLENFNILIDYESFKLTITPNSDCNINNEKEFEEKYFIYTSSIISICCFIILIIVFGYAIIYCDKYMFQYGEMDENVTSEFGINSIGSFSSLGSSGNTEPPQ